MIFVTVGTQLAFDRLVHCVDDWAKNMKVDVQAQIGPSLISPKYIQYSDFLAPDVATEMFKKATLVVSHAGMGSILTALRYKKPILIMPRRASLGEHRNEHQLATAKWLSNKPGIYVADDISELKNMLNNFESFGAGDGISEYASDELIQNIKNFISRV